MNVLSERGVQVRRKFEVPLLITALAIVPVVIIEEQAHTGLVNYLISGVNWLIWIAFASEHLIVGRHATSRRAYAKRDWLNILIIVVSFPLLPDLLAGMRILRLSRIGPGLRVLRLVRLATIMTRGGLAARAIFGSRRLAFVTLTTLLIAIAFGAAFSMVEGDRDLVDGVWWAIVTLTTVGYGDLFPVTGAGRALGGLLMTMGIGYLAYLTAVVAAYFVEQNLAADLNADNIQMTRVEEKLAQIEILLERTIGATTQREANPQLRLAVGDEPPRA